MRVLPVCLFVCLSVCLSVWIDSLTRLLGRTDYRYELIARAVGNACLPFEQLGFLLFFLGAIFSCYWLRLRRHLDWGHIQDEQCEWAINRAMHLLNWHFDMSRIARIFVPLSLTSLDLFLLGRCACTVMRGDPIDWEALDEAEVW